MSLTTYINETYKEPITEVRVNGIKLRDVLSVDISHSFDGLSEAKISMESSNSIEPEAKITVDMGYNDSRVRVFTGIVDSIDVDEYPITYNLNCRDNLKKAMDTFLIQEVKYGLDVDMGNYYYSTYSSVSGGTFQVHEYASLSELTSNHPETDGNYSNEGVKAEAVVQWMLALTGLQEGSEIQVDDTNFWIGDISPAKFHLESIYDAIMKIAELIGWYVYCDRGGVCRFRDRPRVQSDTYKIWDYYSKSSPKNLHNLKKNTSNTDLRNYVEVHGNNGIEVVYRQESPYIGNTPYRGVLIANDLIDTSGIAHFMGERVLEDLNRLKITLDGTSDGNPYLFPGLTVYIGANTFDGPALLLGVNHTLTSEAGFISTWNAEAYTTGDVEPASGIIEAIISRDQVVSVGDPKYLVTLNGSASYSTMGAITDYMWTLPPGSYRGNEYEVAFSGQSVMAVFDQADIISGNHVDVTLQVWDTSGNTASTTSGIYYESFSDEIKYRHLFGAMTNHVAASPDTGQTWYTYPLDAMSVGSSNLGDNASYTVSGYLLIGTSSGLFRNSDFFITPPDKVLEPGGNVLDCYVAELDSRYSLVATDTGEVWSSRDYGFTWSKIGDFEFPVYEVKHAWTDQDYLAVFGPGGTYESYNLGGSWIKRDDLDYEQEIYWADGGAQSNYYAHESGIRAYQYNENIYEIPFGSGYTLSGIMNALSVEVEDDAGVMAVDSTGQHWVISGEMNYYGPLIPTEYNPDNKTRHMLRDGEILNLAYYATQSGIYKSLDGNWTIQPLYVPSGISFPNSFSHTSSMGLGSDGFGEKVTFGPLTDGIYSGISAPIIPSDEQLWGEALPVVCDAALPTTAALNSRPCWMSNGLYYIDWSNAGIPTMECPDAGYWTWNAGDCAERGSPGKRTWLNNGGMLPGMHCGVLPYSIDIKVCYHKLFHVVTDYKKPDGTWLHTGWNQGGHPSVNSGDWTTFPAGSSCIQLWNPGDDWGFGIEIRATP